MKTKHSSHRSAPVLLMLLAILCTGTGLSAARILPTGIGIRTMVSANGLGAAPAFTVQYTGTKWEWEMGANIQLRNTHLSGVQSTLCYYPMRKNALGLRLGFFANLNYNFDALINKNVIVQETFLAPESRMQINDLTLRTLEAQGGFILRVFHTRNLSTFYGVGFGAYQTLGDESNYPLIHREFNHAQLVLNFGINFDIRNDY